MSSRRMIIFILAFAGAGCGSLENIDRSELNAPVMSLDSGIAGTLSPLSGLRGAAASASGCSVCAH